MRLTDTIRGAFVRAVMDDVPRVDYVEQAREVLRKDSLFQLPPKVRAVAEDAALAPYLNTARYNVSRVGGVAVYSADADYKPTPIARKKIGEIEKALEAQVGTRRALEDKLRAAARSATTRKGLVALLPEFEKYLPADDAAACKTLPAVVGVVSDFIAAGWPKGQGTDK